ncbi:MAG TPA: transglutaminase family protein [Candidatus Aquilonibacter sp.]|nr:transglutaminase family protein [Candidatus Aquilonibacter sp.]
MKYDILHRTRYSYAAPVRDSFNDVRLQPMPIPEQTVESFLLKVLPAARLTHFKDFYSNWVNHFEIFEPHSYLMIEAQSRVITHPPAPLPAEKLCSFEQMREAPNIERCFDYLQASRFVELSPEAWKLALDATDGVDDAWLAVLALMKFVQGFLKYEPNSTHVHTHMNQVLKDRRGVCQDFAHLMIGLCRSLKIPARYVSGYLATESASASHAWVEVFFPGQNWRAFDPTHDCQINETYVKIGHGRDYGDVPPVSGNYRGTLERTMKVEVKISPVGSESH